MAIINIDFEVKTLKKAIKDLKSIEKKLNTTVQKEFLTRCAKWVIKRANQNLKSSFLGDSIVNGIIEGWEKPKVFFWDNYCYIQVSNINDKAVYIEFGVGIVGQQQPHPEANNEDYEYNIPTKSKNEEGKWRFVLGKNQDIDLNVGYYNVRAKSSKDTKKLITTKGSPANLYLYNALMSMLTEKPFEKLWQQSLRKVIK